MHDELLQCPGGVRVTWQDEATGEESSVELGCTRCWEPQRAVAMIECRYDTALLADAFRD